MTTIATICARGGSKGVPGKNVRPMLGKPLVAHTVEHALAAPSIDQVYVSTDSDEIAEAAVAAGARYLGARPAHLATDNAPKLPAIADLVANVEATGIIVERIVDLQPTSPLRIPADIEACLALLAPDTDLVITGYVADSNPYFTMVESARDGFVSISKKLAVPVIRRQDAPAVYSMNGSIYCWHRSSFSERLWDGRVRLYEMPRDRSIDIDDEIDWKLAELLLAERQAPDGG